MSPAARMPERVKVFGYPVAERSLKGMWREFSVAGPTAAGAVQLDWAAATGTFVGHSGGPVIDSGGHGLVGVLLEGSEAGRFDRFLPVTLIAGVWPRLPMRWLTTGAEGAAARDHFTRRARGQLSKARGGDLFRGRQEALAAIRGWLCADETPGQVLVVTGQPGAGKSAVLARAALTLEASQAGRGLAFHAHGATVRHFLTAIAELTGVEPTATTDQLVDALVALPEQPPIRVVVDALDEAASETDRRQLAETLTELAVLSGFRVAVASRAVAAGSRYTYGRILNTLDVTGPHSSNLVDLDSDIYVDPNGLRRLVADLLAQQGMDHPAPAGRRMEELSRRSWRAGPVTRSANWRANWPPTTSA
jgi:hypothetical protein